MGTVEGFVFVLLCLLLCNYHVLFYNNSFCVAMLKVPRTIVTSWSKHNSLDMCHCLCVARSLVNTLWHCKISSLSIVQTHPLC